MTTFGFHLSFISLCFLLAGCGGSFKEMQNPIQKQEKVSLIEQFGFKTGCNFRQTLDNAVDSDPGCVYKAA